jgi:hypothetical protein
MARLNKIVPFLRVAARVAQESLRKSGYRMRIIGICDNFSGTVIGWCRCARIMNQLHALAMNEGYRWKKKLFSEQGRAQFEKLTVGPWASRRRQELLELWTA